MTSTASTRELEGVVRRIRDLGLRPHVSVGEERTIVGVVGSHDVEETTSRVASLAGVDSVVPIRKPYKLASREMRAADTVIQVNDVRIGGGSVAVMAGPCSVESHDQVMRIARELHARGVKVLRGGAFKPRTSPYSFQGMGEAGLKILAAVREELGMSIVTEVMTAEEVPLVAQYADILQVGTRNMQNYRLLEALGRQRRPVLLKRGMSATIEELLLAAEYILAGGNPAVMLCERGIRTFEPSTRATFDLNAVPLLRSLTHLPVIVDPSHATGRADLVVPVALGALAAGADGMIVEVHDAPEQSASDGAQSLRPAQVDELLAGSRAVAGAVGRQLDLALRPVAADTPRRRRPARTTAA